MAVGAPQTAVGAAAARPSRRSGSARTRPWWLLQAHRPAPAPTDCGVACTGLPLLPSLRSTPASACRCADSFHAAGQGQPAVGHRPALRYRHRAIVLARPAAPARSARVAQDARVAAWPTPQTRHYRGSASRQGRRRDTTPAPVAIAPSRLPHVRQLRCAWSSSARRIARKRVTSTVTPASQSSCTCWTSVSSAGRSAFLSPRALRRTVSAWLKLARAACSGWSGHSNAARCAREWGRDSTARYASSARTLA